MYLNKLYQNEIIKLKLFKLNLKIKFQVTKGSKSLN
jgi:hypothetical protein